MLWTFFGGIPYFVLAESGITYVCPSYQKRIAGIAPIIDLGQLRKGHRSHSLCEPKNIKATNGRCSIVIEPEIDHRL